MSTILIILFIHFVADFVLQSRKMGLKKGKSLKWLNFHVLVYSVTTTLCWLVFSPELITILYILCWTFMTHFLTDLLTSNISGLCYLKMEDAKFRKEDYDAHLGMKDRYDDEVRAQLIVKRDHQESNEHTWQYMFWGVIGIDQFIHATTLLLTYNYLIKPI